MMSERTFNMIKIAFIAILIAPLVMYILMLAEAAEAIP